MSLQPPSGHGRGSAILLLAILMVIIAGLIVWARSAHSPGRPVPSATGIPPTAPANPSASRH